LVDPFAEKKRPWKTWVVLGVVVVAVVMLWYQGVFAGLMG
jgi:RsiW-degrading membrane proteinase PrsW (M82 family)